MMRLPKQRLSFCCVVALALSGCSTNPSRPDPQPSPLVVANCPELTPLADDSFGATTLKLVEVAGIYYRCRAAALAASPP